MNTQKQEFENLNIEESIQRLDKLLKTSPPATIEKMGFALGIRLALGMAKEIRDGIPLSSETGAMIANWVTQYGEAQVEAAVQTARHFLTQPGNIKKGLEERLFASGTD